MKKIFSIMCFALLLIIPRVQAQDFNGYLAALDTLTNTANSSHDVTITGAKHNISFQCNVIKISGTVAGNFQVFGSVDGTTFETTAIQTTAKADATANYVIKLSYNAYKAYRIVSTSSGTNSHSERTYLVYRKAL